MNPGVDQYFIAGCGRCPLGNTPACKVHNWVEAMERLRLILLDCGLTEELKWSVPCYTYQQKNIAILSAFKEYASLGFFKGSLLKDPHGILDKPGAHSQAARIFRFTRVQEVEEKEAILKAYIREAVEVEKAGLKVDFKEKHALDLAAELQQKLDEDPVLKAAFESLTPGRQRGYNLYFSAPKQSQTRMNRVEKCIPDILAGKGFHDR